MQNYYEKEVLITSTYADRRCEVGIFQAGILIQDAMTEFFHQYDCDAIQMSRTHQAVWAIARTKIVMDQDILWMDRIRIKIFPVKISNVAIHLNILFESLDGHPLLRARQELCAIDSVNHTLRRIDTTPFPMDLPPMEPVLTTPCRRMKLKLGPEHQLYTHTVRTMDTDMKNLTFIMSTSRWKGKNFKSVARRNLAHYLHRSNEAKQLSSKLSYF